MQKLKNFFILMVTFLALALLITCAIAGNAGAVTLAWDSPSDNPTGYTLYFGPDGDTSKYRKSFPAADVANDDTQCRYDIDDGYFPIGEPATFTLYAYDANGVSGPSNSPTWTRPAYAPPPDVLPPADESQPPAPPGNPVISFTFNFAAPVQ